MGLACTSSRPVFWFVLLSCSSCCFKRWEHCLIQISIACWANYKLCLESYRLSQSSYNFGDIELLNNIHLTLRSSLHFVATNTWLFSSPTLNQALRFLVKLLENRVGYCGTNTTRSSLSCIINPLVLILQLQGSWKEFFEPATQSATIHTNMQRLCDHYPKNVLSLRKMQTWWK